MVREILWHARISEAKDTYLESQLVYLGFLTWWESVQIFSCVIHCVCHSLLSSTNLPRRLRPRECLGQGRWFTEWVFGFVLKFFSNSKYCEFLKVKDPREHMVFGSQMKIPRCWEVQFSLKVTKIFRGKGDGDKIWCTFFHFIIWVDC